VPSDWCSPRWCHYCDQPGATRDHVVPRSLLRHVAVVRAGSGPEWPANVVPCCLRCNQMKGDKRSDCECQTCVVAWAVYGPVNRPWPEVVPVRALAVVQDYGT
jgi:hypothetical protein